MKSSPAQPDTSLTALSALLEAFDDMVAIVAEGGRVLAANRKWEGYFAAEHSDALRTLGAVVSKGVQQVTHGRKPHFSSDTDSQQHTEQTVYHRVDVHRLEWSHAEAVVVITDLSPQKRAERALAESRDQLYQAQKMDALGTLVAGMAHEINNPISLIMFNLPIIRRVWQDVLPALRKTTADAPDHRFGGYSFAFIESRLGQLVADMEMAASRVSKIVKDLKDFSRQSPLADQTSMTLNTAVENAVRLAGATVRKSGARLDLELAPDLPTVTGNLASIEQILLNLLINAVQAIERSPGRIRIQTGADLEHDKVFVSVSDNGRGVSEAIADKLFDPFVSDKQKQGGTGLGLAVSYNLARAHGGTIHFKAADGGGTTFVLTLPTKAAPRVPRVLVVDDDPQVRQLMVQALERTRRYRVAEAANGVDGLIKIGAAPPDLLVLDLMMPGMNGLAVCQAIQKNTQLAAMRVLITTGHPLHADLQQIAALGYEDIYSKPISPAAFLHKIDAIMAPRD